MSVPGDDDHRAIDAAERAASIMTAAGMQRMPARVLMALVAGPAGGYTAADIGERLGVSAAAVSGAVRYLQQIHLVERRSRPGDRRDRYELARQSFYGSVVSNVPVYTKLAESIEEIGDAHEDDTEAQVAAQELAEFFRFMARRLPELVEEWRQSLPADH